ncbi:hypothetical protein JG687_00011756 [Phytophthora cactorum]|uniref:RxLR effector protein n=1 Tax=Phytophthora cactorum TaxID=29920 RepID=A0A329SRI6_9STRA|nr:hypothetical protein Pcac1_g27653 [Phytophthora cactorum]KAG2806358.1 hypothetical protein PC112_g17875 [Phytophthora cactorum]KAG2808019.1 hypothetical protein PC111_g16674 [Phytophthora cactorum]KAG2865636.1 hypothetical protein PC113_g3505 [Phytophthora cactorum]KAG2912012.1 hypothetical protein PC117_g19007 [Phytophthora cactorum]
MKFGVFTVLLVSALAIASAQDPNTVGGQAGSVVSDPNVPTTTEPTTTTPPTAAPAGVNAAAPAPPAFAAPQAPWDANPAPMTDISGSASFGSAGDIETPLTKKPKRITNSPSSTPTPTEDSSASSTTGAWAIAGLALGLVAML